MRSVHSIAAFGLVAALTAPGAATAAAKLEWDQDKVTAIAQELPKAVDDLRNAMRNEPEQVSSVSGRRSFHRLTDIVRRVERESRHLAARLKEGKGHDETLPIFENLGVMVRDGREQARSIFRTDSLSNRITAVRGILDRLAPYYDASPLPPPLTRDSR